MVALCNRADHIYFHPVVCSLFFFLQILMGFAPWQRYCTASSGRQPNFAELNRGRHLCSAGRPSRWASAHILVLLISYALPAWNVSVCWSCRPNQCFSQARL